jgi:hypothetical protein
LAIAAAARSGCARCASAPRRATRTGSGATAGRCRPSRRVGRSTRTSLGCPPDGYNLRASYVQVNPRKTKQNQGKMLGFPWIPLAESGLFKGLQRIQIKKSSPASTLVTGCALNPLGETHSLPFTQASTARGSTRMFVTQISDFAKPIRNADRDPAPRLRVGQSPRGFTVRGEEPGCPALDHQTNRGDPSSSWDLTCQLSAARLINFVDHVAPARRTGADGPLLWLRNRNRSVTSNAATRPWQVTRARRSPRGGKLRPISWHWR